VERFAIVGSRGFLGDRFVRYFQNSQDILKISGMSINQLVFEVPGLFTRRYWKVSEAELEREIGSFGPAAIVNCSGLVGDLNCLLNPREAEWANVTFVNMLASVARRLSIPLVHFSSDAVFGDLTIDRVETDSPKPTTLYGETKFRGEKIVLSESQNLVVRTNFFGYCAVQEKGLFNFYLNNLRNGNRVRGFIDVLFNPVLISDIPHAISKAVILGMSGILHISGGELISKYRFGCIVSNHLDIKSTLIQKYSARDSYDSKQRCLMFLNSQRLDSIGVSLKTLVNGVKSSCSEAKNGIYESIENK